MLASELVAQKRKYWSKILKESAIWTNYQRAVDTASLFEEHAWRQTMFFIWLDISGVFSLGLQPYEMEPLDPEFETKLPTVEEFLQGIKLKVIRADVGETWLRFWWDIYRHRVPPLLDYLCLVMATVYPEYADAFLGQLKRKLTVGESVYGVSYVDPVTVRDLMRSTLLRLAQKRMDFTRIKVVFDEMVEKKLVAEHMVELIYNRMALHAGLLTQVFMLDFNLLGYSRLTPKGSEESKVAFETWRGKLVGAEVSMFEEAQVGLILDVTPLGLGMLMPRGKHVYKPSPRARAEVGTPVLAHFVDWKIRKMSGRYRATGVAFGNYQRPDEAVSWQRSERADHYHQLRDLYRHLDFLVDGILEGRDIDVFRKNLYKRAAAQLIGHRKKRHKWGYKAFESMSEEEFKEWWLEHWRRQGLSINILEDIYQQVVRWAPQVRGQLRELGERLSERRKQLAALVAA